RNQSLKRLVLSRTRTSMDIHRVHAIRARGFLAEVWVPVFPGKFTDPLLYRLLGSRPPFARSRPDRSGSTTSDSTCARSTEFMNLLLPSPPGPKVLYTYLR